MGFTVHQATSALQHSGGSLDAALNSLLPSDHQNASTNGQPAHSGRESRTPATSNVTSNEPAHRNDRADTRAQQMPDSSVNDRTSMLIFMCSVVLSGTKIQT